ncbi:MAG TPA: hypothetical protein V6D30_11325 [Leptolyngbyaceae cyanobacterium]
MHNAERYPFISTDATLGEAGFRPSLPIKLIYQQQSITVFGLLDTGATVNVLPYSVGVELGCVWEQQTTALSLTGNLAQYEARALGYTVIFTSSTYEEAQNWLLEDEYEPMEGQLSAAEFQ